MIIFNLKKQTIQIIGINFNQLGNYNPYFIFIAFIISLSHPFTNKLHH